MKDAGRKKQVHAKPLGASVPSVVKKILIIEDEPSVADNITYALETEGFKPTWCATGEAGLECLDKEAFDLIVLDVGLPDASGFDICKQIRARSAVPIIFLTARQEEIDRVLGLELGADDYMVKPFSPRELTARIRAILRRAAQAPGPGGPPAINTPFEVDEERHTITYFGTPLELTRYEFRLLRIFIEHPGRVFSRSVLMEEAWEEPDASMERTVDAHVRTLRAKLKKVKPEIDPLVTHRGLGYALREDW